MQLLDRQTRVRDLSVGHERIAQLHIPLEVRNPHVASIHQGSRSLIAQTEHKQTYTKDNTFAKDTYQIQSLEKTPCVEINEMSWNVTM
jgi:hypothetical protein